MVSRTTNVLIIGGGAIGGILGWRLQSNSDVRVTFLCRSNYQTVSSSGYQIQSESFGNDTYKPSRVLHDLFQAVGDGTRYDYIIICTKALPNLEDNSLTLGPVLFDPRTVIIVVQSGIGVEHPFASKYPENPIASSVIYTNCSQPLSGTIDHSDDTYIIMGLYSAPGHLPTPSYDKREALESLRFIADKFAAAGVRCSITDAIQRHRWAKLVRSASLNVVSVVSGGNSFAKMVDNLHCRELLRNLMEEIYTIGEAATRSKLPASGDCSGPDEIIREAGVRKLKPVDPSMLTDLKLCRPMEHEVILRNPILVADKLGINVPHLKAIYAMIVMIEKRCMLQMRS